MAVKADLDASSSEDQKALSDHLDRLQSLESEKLKFTVDFQLAQQQSRDDPGDELLERNAKGIKERLNDLASDISDVVEEIRYLVYDSEDVDK